MSSENIASRFFRPEDCVLGFGIPTSAAGFWGSWRRACPDSFVQSFPGRYSQYNRDVIVPFGRLEPRFRRLGVRVVPDLSLERFATLFRDSRTHAVILMSHWGPHFVEFRDGPADCDELIAAVPESFAGVIDLCVCHPQELVPRLRACRPKCLLHYIAAEATPIVWLHYFNDLFFHLRQGKRSYLDASLELQTVYFEPNAEIADE